MWIFRIVNVMIPFIILPVEAIQTFISSNPDDTVSIYEDGIYYIVRQTVRIFRDMIIVIKARLYFRQLINTAENSSNP